MNTVFFALLAACATMRCTESLSHMRLRRFEQSLETMDKQDSSQDLWFEQRLDNFHSTDYTTWMQRYFMEPKYSRPGGPVFLQIGGEGPANAIWMSEGHWITLAQQNHALCFMIEHRFYGKSHPTSDVSSSNLAYLSSEQALADIANFITKMTEKHSLQNRKWIVFGGSYSGALAIWARLKYPHLVSGAVSASAPLDALVDFTGYLEVVEDSLAHMADQSCVENLSRASALVATHLKSSSGRKNLDTSFRLCSPLAESGRDDSYFQESLAGNVMDVVQYNRDNRRFEGGGKSLTIVDVCGFMNNASIGDEMDRYASLNSRQLELTGQSCLDADYDQYLMYMSNTSWESASGARQWVYQTCSEFGWYQTADSTHQPFLGFHIKYSLEQCQAAYGISASHVSEAVKRSNEMYGSRAVADVVSNVTLYNGGVDPWSNVSYVVRGGGVKRAMEQPKIGFGKVLTMQKQLRSSHPRIVTQFVPTTAHCAIMYPASEDDPHQLTLARSEVENEVRRWLS